MASETDADRVLELTCVFAAPLQPIYDAWTRPDAMRWMAPREFTTLATEMDPRPGGRWRVAMRAPEGTEHVEFGVVREIVPNERLVLTHAWRQPDGKPGHETLITVGFEPHGDTTHVAFRHGTFESKRSRDLHEDGWVSAFGVFAQALGAHIDAGTLGRPGAAAELIQHTRPMLEILRVHLTTPDKRTTDDARNATGSDR